MHICRCLLSLCHDVIVTNRGCLRKKAGISAENRGNWRAEIWNRTKNVVPLHCQNEGEKWRAS